MLKGFPPVYRGKCSVCGGERDRPGERRCKACHKRKQAEYRERLKADLELTRGLISVFGREALQEHLEANRPHGSAGTEVTLPEGEE
jgi:tRNA(Ile2) C34 agmatinyltransferase TiaS